MKNSAIVVVSENSFKAVTVQVVTCQGLTIEMVKPDSAPAHGEFLPAKVSEGAVTHWMFKADHPGYRENGGMAILRELPGKKGEYAIVLIRQRATALDGILPLTDIPFLRKTAEGEIVTFGGTKLSDIISLKCAMALELKLSPEWTKREQKLIDATNAMAKEAAAQESAWKKAEEEARQNRRQEVRREITGRKNVSGFTASGQKRFGTPVVGNEWESLPVGRYAVAVTSFNKETSEVGKLIESFQVIQKGSRKSRDQVTAITSVLPERKKAETIPFTMVIMNIKNGEGVGMEEVMLVADKGVVKALREDGLNSGTLVAYLSDVPEQYQVVAVKHSGIDTVGYGTII